MDVLPSGNLFRELQDVTDTGYFEWKVSLEDYWQQVRSLRRGDRMSSGQVAVRIALADKTNAFDNTTDNSSVNVVFTRYKYPGFENNVPFDTFRTTIIEASKEQLNNIVDNINEFYKLSDKIVDNVNSTNLYEYTFQHNLKKIINDKIFNVSEAFMLNFIDLSNLILARTIDNLLKSSSLDQMIGINATSKIIKHQIKISTTFIENTMCDSFSLCKDINKYSEYLTILLRAMMDLTPSNLKVLFQTVPKVLKSYKHIIKTNTNLRAYCNYLINVNSTVQRDALDVLDEVLTNPKKAFENSPQKIRKKIGMLIELFKLLDDVYDLNEENYTQWENIAMTLKKWIDNGENLVEEALTAIIANFWINMKIWPLHVQSEVSHTWSMIIRI